MKRHTVFVLVAALAAVASGRIIHVPGEYQTIQAGIDAAQSGDVVMVAAGTYPEEILLKAGVIVQGAGEELSTIDGGDDPGDVVRAIGSSITRDTKLRGFTIRGALNSGGMPGGGGVFCNSGAKPDIGNCRITGNDCGVACWNASEAYVHNCVIVDNVYNGISTGAGATFVNNTIHDCRIGFSDNSGYGPVFMNNIVTGCGLYGVYGPSGGTPPQLSYNDVWGNATNYRQATPGTGSISADPLYEDTLAGDFSLQSGSPCIDTGNPAPQYNDPDGSRNDIGAYGGPEATSNLLTVVNVDPEQNALEVDPGTDVSAGFNLDLDPGTVSGGTFLARGLFTGVHYGEVDYDSSARVATLDPDVSFLPGEPVSVTLARGIATPGGDSLPGFGWGFTAAVTGGSGLLAARVVHRSNGGVNAVALADLDRDGNLDVLTTNEDGGNVAVLLGDGNGGLAERVLYPAGDNAHGLCCGDFNQDSVLDIGAAVSGADSVAVLIGNGDGTFQAAVRYAAGDFPEDVRCADLDLDGILDLVTANALGDDVALLRGNGDGTFEPPERFSTGDEPQALTVGDFDDDGFPDLAVACSGADQVSVLMGNGDGTFRPAAAHNVGTDPYSVASADFDEDGDLDLVVSNLMSASVSYLAGDGAGGFAARVNHAAGSGPRSVTTGDFDADGHLDLLVANEGSDSVALLFGTGSGDFLSPLFFEAGSEPLHAACGDLDNDGDLDVVATAGDRDVSVFLNEDQLEVVLTLPAQHATAAPETVDLRSSFSIPVDPASLDSVSFRCFGSQSGAHPGAVGYDSASRTAWLDPDQGFAPGEEVHGLLTTDIESRSGVNLRGFSWRFSTRVRTPSSGELEDRQDFPSGQGTRGFWAADLDSDGDCDIAVGSADYPNPGQLVVLKNNGDGTFAAPSCYSLGYADPIALFGADMDGDGDVDIVSGHNEPGTSHLVVMMNDGSGAFSSYRSYAPAILGQHLSGGDLDADGDIDIVFIDGFGTTDHVKVMFNNGDGSLAGPVSYSAGSFTRGCAVLDTDNDGDNDVLVCNSGNDNLSVFQNDGTGALPDQSAYPTGHGPTQVWGHDLDADGWADLVTSGSDGNVTVLLGNGDGTFAPPQGYAAGGDTRHLVGGDLDGDGDLDLVATHSSAQSAAVLPSNGDGTFGAATVYGLGDYPSGLGLADFDLDGALDLAGGNYNDADVAVWYNTGLVGIAGPREPGARPAVAATVVRGMLLLPVVPAHAGELAMLFDAGGRLTVELVPGANDVSRLAPGVYFLRVGGEECRQTGKVVIAR